jgi:hypothetical protein
MPQGVASRPTFTPLGFAFFHLVSNNHREPGEPPYSAVRLCEPRRAMTAFVHPARVVW